MRMKYSRPTGRSSPTGSLTSHTSLASTDGDPELSRVYEYFQYSFLYTIPPEVSI